MDLLEQHRARLRVPGRTRVNFTPKTAATPWYRSSSTLSPSIKKPHILAERHTFASTKNRGRRPKANGSGSESYSSSSESDGEGGRKSKRSGRCWRGYKPVPGKKAYSPGSCKKA
jgi:hypothetical protein